MIEAELRTEAEKLADYIESLGSSFAILRATPSKHIGAIIADAVLQVRHRWKTQVEKRVVRIETHYPQAATLSGLSRLLATVGEKELLNWSGKDEQRRFRQTIEFFSEEEVNGQKINTVSQLAGWLALDTNRDRLLTKSQRKDRAGIPRMADKTADYYRVMVGLPDAVAIDSLITGFLRDAKVRGRSRYDWARTIVQLAAPVLSASKHEDIRPVDLDLSIWEYQSKKREGVGAGYAGSGVAAVSKVKSKEECKMNEYNEVLEVMLPSEVMKQLQAIASELFGVDKETLARLWIVEKLTKQYSSCSLVHAMLDRPPGGRAVTIREKIRSAVEEKWAYDQPFTRRELIREVQRVYPEVKDNEILPADLAINSKSAYYTTPTGWQKKDKYLFVLPDGRYERYDPRRHGSGGCVDDGKGGKRIVWQPPA